MELFPDQRRMLLDVSRQTIRAALGAADPGVVENPDDPVLHQPAGSFVTLHTLNGHRLRGCVGRLDSRESLLAAVRQSAQNVLQDPRFVNCPVCLSELPLLELEITVIFPLRPAADCQDFDPLTDGIYLTINERAGCFLPQVARETGWNRQQLLARLCTEKLGLSERSWQLPGARLQKFATLLIGPEPFLRPERGEMPQDAS